MSNIQNLKTSSLAKQISIDDAVKLEKIMGRIKAQLHSRNYGNSNELIEELALLRLDPVYVQPHLDTINRITQFKAHAAYRERAYFYPPKTLASAAEEELPCIFDGINLWVALHGPDHEDNPQPFPFEKFFARLRVADRDDGGFYITPYHKHEPGARCCYVHDDPCGDGSGSEAFNCMCDANEGEYNALRVKDYLKSGLITLDEIKPFMYGQIDEPTPDNVYSDDKRGLFFLDGAEPVRICSTVYPVAEVIDETGKRNVGRRIRFWNGAAWAEHTLMWRALQSDGTAMFQELSDVSLPITDHPKARAAFRSIVTAPRKLPTVTQYSRPGWHKDRFVLPNGFAVDGNGTSPALVAREAATIDQGQGGTFEAWRDGVAAEIWKGDCPQFAMGQLAGLVGVITSLVRTQHPVVHFSGPPSSGKSTAQEIAAGLTCNPAPGQGTLVTLQDDVDSILPKAIGTSAHIDDPTKHGSPTKVERLMYRALEHAPFTVSSVATLETIVERAGGKMDEGVRRRVLTVDTRKIAKISPARANTIKRAAQENYGHAAPWFLDYVIGKGTEFECKALLKMVQDAADKLPGDMMDGETYSAAQHIGALQVTGELMIGAGLVPEGADVSGVLLGVWNDWLERRSASPVNRAIAELDAALSDAGGLGSDPEALCWTQDGVGYVPTGQIEAIIGSEIKAAIVMRHLKDSGRLIAPAGKGLAWQYLPGQLSCQHYRVRLQS